MKDFTAYGTIKIAVFQQLKAESLEHAKDAVSESDDWELAGFHKLPEMNIGQISLIYDAFDAFKVEGSIEITEVAEA